MKSTLVIKDLPLDKELDRKEMSTVVGGVSTLYQVKQSIVPPICTPPYNPFPYPTNPTNPLPPIDSLPYPNPK